ncbi:MAG: acyltransferase family protein [Candidatus Electrothrix sp. GW3-4]|uniref:acyltransferase family protein n=1 Tax=Candidatus Electrothrix sp. GW3-4 TaxID=3126740 RepID=UPI0030CDEB88
MLIQRKYSPEVDGLRAWAVLGVLLYHFDFKRFSGGFTGVDIFFVISGFLITRNIMSDIDKGTFSFARFYSRRIKRLFPALYTTLLLTLVFGFLLFTPEHLLRLGKSLLYSVLSVSNFFFWKEAGYFDTAIDFKPLLHTWSLAVEEQFYLIWPALLFLFSKLSRKIWLPVFLLLISAASLYGAERWLDSDPTGAFFLTPFRIIEFAFGAGLVWLIDRQPKKKLLLEPLQLAALLLILYSFFSFTKHTSFPGLSALIPCLGAALAIYSGQARFLGYLLRNRLAVGIGLISYSLYLVHWPLLIFYKYWHYSEIDHTDRISLLLTTFLCAWLSWKFIEQPFRKGFTRSRKLLVFFYIASAALLIGAAVTLIREKGFPERIDSKYSKLQDTEQFHIDQYGGKGYRFTGLIGARKPKKYYDVLLAGDSFMLQYATGFDQYFQQENIGARTVTDYSCFMGPGITSFVRGKPDHECTERTQQMFSLLEQYDTPLILSEAWAWYFPEGICDLNDKPFFFKKKKDYLDFLIKNIEKIREKIGKDRRLILIGNPPGSGNRNGIISCLNRPNYLPNNCLDSVVFPKRKGVGFDINKRLQEYAESEEHTWFIDPFDVFCDKESCAALDSSNNEIWYSDGGHLSIDGSIKATQSFGQQLLDIIRPTMKAPPTQ